MLCIVATQNVYNQLIPFDVNVNKSREEITKLKSVKDNKWYAKIPGNLKLGK